MSKNNYALSTSESILAAARRAAKRDGVSLNQFINNVLTEKVAALATEEVFTHRAVRADRACFPDVLVVETPDGNLARGMRELNGVYTQRFNRVHQGVGHVFQD